MKKLISLLLVLTLAMSLVSGVGITALADDEPIEAVEIEPAAEDPAPDGEELPGEEPADAEAAPVQETEEVPAEAVEEVPEEAPAEEPVEETAYDEETAPVLDASGLSVTEWILGSEDALKIELSKGTISQVTIDGTEVEFSGSKNKVSVAASVINALAVGEHKIHATAATSKGEDASKDFDLTVKAAEGADATDNSAAEETTPASGGLTVGQTYALFVTETDYLLNDDGTLKANKASSGAYSTSNPRGAITPAAGANGGYTFTINGTALGVSGGQMVLGATAGEWFYADGVLSYKEGDSVLYVAGDGLTMGAAQGAAVKMLAITASSGGGGGGGGGGKSNTYSKTTTLPNLVYVDAPHWINLSDSEHETTKEVTLTARFPDGVEADAMTFTWSFGEGDAAQTKVETIPASKAVDGVFTSTFVVSVKDFGAGVYPVSCQISFEAYANSSSSSSGSSGTTTTGEGYTFTLGSTDNVKVTADVRGKPTVTIDGKEIETIEDMSADPPASYMPAETLNKLTAGTHAVVVTGDGESVSQTLEIVDPNASSAPLPVGKYIIGVQGSDGFVAISSDGGAAKTDLKAPAASVIWESELSSDGSHSKLTNDKKLKAGGSGLALTGGSASFWVMKGSKLAFEDVKNGTFYVTYADGAFGVSTDEAAAASISVVSATAAAAPEPEKEAETAEPVDEEPKLETFSIDVNVNVILAKGVKENSLITFSDVHETWDDVGTAVYDTIIANSGLIPALIIATGDFNNNRIAGNNEAYINGCVNEIINRVSLQLAGIDTVWVSGNHDNGFAAQYTNYNLQADLGIEIDDYANEAAGISGTGIIFDTRSDGYAKNAESSQYEDGLIVIGLNYEDGDAFSKNDYGTGEEEGDSVYKHIKTALDSAAANYNGELVVISSHAGLHNLKDDADGSTSSDDNGYTISNSAAIVKLVNSYVEKYDMDIIWFFGHDHSRGEEEMIKLPGAVITATNSFVKDSEEDNEDIELKFTYAHAGYVGKGAAGINNRNYTYLTWDDTSIIRKEGVADGTHSYRDFLPEGELHYYGTKGTLSFTLDRIAKIIAEVTEGGVVQADKDTIKKFAVPAGFENYAFFSVVGYKIADGDKTVATEAEVADADLSFVLPFPDGLDFDKYDYEFKVLHLAADGLKEESFTQTAAGLRVAPESLSPFAIVYKQTLKAAAPDNTKKDDNKKPDDGKKAPDQKPDAPKTGDETNIVVWVAVLVICAGSAAVILPRKRFHK